jgi:hypothetical protein
MIWFQSNDMEFLFKSAWGTKSRPTQQKSTQYVLTSFEHLNHNVMNTTKGPYVITACPNRKFGICQYWLVETSYYSTLISLLQCVSLVTKFMIYKAINSFCIRSPPCSLNRVIITGYKCYYRKLRNRTSKGQRKRLEACPLLAVNCN